MNWKVIISSLLVAIGFFEVNAQRATNVVISEVYGGGGGSTGTYKFDYVELYNPTDNEIDISTWSLQYNSASGTNPYQVSPLTGKVKAKGFFLIQLGNAGSAGVDLPTADFLGMLSLSQSNGKVALVSNTTPLPAASEANAANIVDYVGYGSANKWEGAGATVALTSTAALERKASSGSTAISLGRGGSEEFGGNGFDSNNNSLDFVLLTTPFPQNSLSLIEGVANAPNLVVSLTNIAFGSSNVGLVTSPKEYTLKGTNLSAPVNLTTAAPFSISKSASGPFTSTLSFLANEVTGDTKVYVVFQSTEAREYSGSINHLSTGLPSSVTIKLTGRGVEAGSYYYDFTGCSSTGLADGFSQFSSVGAELWGCTTFGRDANDVTGKASTGGALQMSGFASSKSNPNDDYLVSPKISISSNAATTPILSFYYRTKFDGKPLKIYATKDYVSGDPSKANLVEVAVQLTSNDLDTWTKSADVDLSFFKGSDIHIVWQYFSDTNIAARWTLDDVNIFNAVTKPNAILNLSSPALSFDFVPTNGSGTYVITGQGANLGKETSIRTNSPFSINVGNGFSTNETVQNSISSLFTKDITIKFEPKAPNTIYVDTLKITASNGASKNIPIYGNSFNKSATFDVCNFNIEWFSGPNGPTSDSTQEANALTIMKAINADLYGCTEIVDTLAFKTLAENLGSYGYYVSTFASGASTTSSGGYANSQKLAFAYNKQTVKPIKVGPLLYSTSTTDSAYVAWSSGRFPYMLEADVTINGQINRVFFILIHGKAQTSTVSYQQRKNAARQLKTYIDANLTGKNVMILGDFNDDLDQTVASSLEAGADFPKSSYSVMIDDTANYKPLSLPLSLNGEKSTSSFSDVVDHVMVSPSLAKFFIPTTAQILDELCYASVSNYAGTTSDHFPLITRFNFGINVSTTDALKVSTLDVYPNPTSGMLTLKTGLGNGEVLVFDNLGRQLSKILVKEDVTNIDLTSQSAGIYHVLYQSKSDLQHAQIVITK